MRSYRPHHRHLISPFGIAFTLATVLGMVWYLPRGLCQEGKGAVSQGGAKLIRDQSLTRKLLEGDPKRFILIAPERGPEHDGKPFVYPPKTLEKARATERLDPDVSVSVKLDRTEYRLLEPIVVDVEVKNCSDARKWMQASNSPYNVAHINIYQSPELGGEILPKSAFLNHSGDVAMSGGSVGMDFPPGETKKYRLILNLYTDLTWPEEYYFFAEFLTGKNVEIRGIVTPRVARSKEFKIKIIRD